MRVFCDRLITAEDVEMVADGLIPDLIKEYFPGTDEYVMENPILYGDYLTSQPLDEE